MSIFEIIKQLDTHLFLIINGLYSPFFDNFMLLVSGKIIWIPLYASVLYVLIKNWKIEAIWLILAFILCIVISDQFASGFLKNTVKRLRPSSVDELSGVIHLVKGYLGGGKYGFASSHASNSFGFAMLSALILRRKNYTIAIFSWAIVVGYSRIYLGAHYPLDVLGGAAIGITAAYLCKWLLLKFRPIIFQTKLTDEKLPIAVLILSFLGICIFGFVF
jgi:undecaprenyl-diphosphatase